MPDSLLNATTALEAALAAKIRAERTTETLRLSEVRYRRLFETARDGILMLDSGTGKITDANPFMEELLGYSQSDFVGKELWEIGLLHDKATSQDAFLTLQQDHYIRYESMPLKSATGDIHEVEFVSNLYRESGHTVIQCNIRDITDRRGIEKALAIAADRNERIAETLQRSMLIAPPPGKFAGVEVETLYVPAMDDALVGGDFFDAFALSSDHVALVVGDVSGKGLVAAARTAEVKYGLRAFLSEYKSPELALRRLNDFICETARLNPTSGETFIVLALVVLNTLTGELMMSSAGTEPTLILRRDGSMDAMETPGCALGVYSGSTYKIVKTNLSTNETVVMATDGITEARHGHEFLGSNGLADIIRESGVDASLTKIKCAIHDGALDFAGGVLKDDACVLLARYVKA